MGIVFKILTVDCYCGYSSTVSTSTLHTFLLWTLLLWTLFCCEVWTHSYCGHSPTVHTLLNYVALINCVHFPTVETVSVGTLLLWTYSYWGHFSTVYTL